MMGSELAILTFVPAALASRGMRQPNIRTRRVGPWWLAPSGSRETSTAVIGNRRLFDFCLLLQAGALTFPKTPSGRWGEIRTRKFAISESFPAADESRDLSVPVEKKRGGGGLLTKFLYYGDTKEQTKRNE